MARRRASEKEAGITRIIQAVGMIWAATAGGATMGAPYSARNRGGGPTSSTMADSGVMWVTRSQDLEVVMAFLRLVAVWDVSFINRSGSMRFDM